jgi:hypothetical protein
MNIVKTSGTLTAKEMYALTMSPKVQKMKDAISQRIEITAWVIYTDINSDPKNEGKEQTILAILSPEGDVHATNSKTFMEDFQRMLDMFAGCGEAVTAIEVISGTSKAGREFITCAYAE